MNLRSTTQKPHSFHLNLIVGLSIAIISTIILLCFEAKARHESPTGYLQEWTSETMWQTVSIVDLRDQPLQSLWYLHIQPPMFDTIRTVLAQVWKMDDSKAMRFKVDTSIYFIWAIVYGLMIFVIYWWLFKMTNIYFAAIASVFISIHPAIIAYSVLLDTTLLSSLLVLFFYYFLWRVKEGHSVSAVGMAISFLLLYFTRSVFQWQWLIPLAFSLILMKFPWRKLIVFLSITGIVVGMYTAKQLILFDLSSTSSFSGFNYCSSINMVCSRKPYFVTPAEQDPSTIIGKANVLTRTTKIDGGINYNNEVYLAVNDKIIHEYHSELYALLHKPFKLLQLYSFNLINYFQPSSKFTPIPFVANYPFRNFYDAVFSYPILVILLILSILSWIFRAHKSDLLRTIGFCLPALLIMFICIVCERGENMRYKFFIEPVLYVFIASQVFVTGKRVIGYIERQFKKSSI